ncbi:MAG: penicillin acylase family protein [Acidimicrobiales bacterium]|jgi:acyl-homoserine-lactone acylase
MARRSVLTGTLVTASLVVGLIGTSAAGALPTRSAASGHAKVIHLAANQVTIVRDSAGIPHITATNFRSLGYGEAWAFSQDNFCTLAQDFVTLNGDRSKYFGPNKLAVNYSAGTTSTNLASDFFWQSVRDSSLFKSETAAPPPIGPLPQVKAIYGGFVAGYNAYLKSGQLNDPTCKNKAWVKPISLEDMFLRGVQIATEASSAQFISYEAATEPPAAGSPKLASQAATHLDAGALAKLREDGSSSNGSNGIGVGSTDTRAHDGMVLANPHFPWQGTERFWMVQLTVPGKYDAEGGTLEGFPLIGIGFNQNLAWTHTVSTDSRFTLYQLKLEAHHPMSYMVNGKAVPMGKETVRVNTGHGSATHTFYTTRWGTVVNLPPATYAWTSTTAYVLDDVNFTDEYRAANQYFEMGRATSVKDLLTVEEQYLAIPTFNTIASDDHGNALYADVGNVPNVTTRLIKACLPPGVPTEVYDVAGIVTLDGSTTSCAWGTNKGTPVPGILNGSQLPHLITTDFVENSNDSYWLADPSKPFRAYSPIIGAVDVEQGLRTRLGDLMIAERVKGTDGLGPKGFTIPTLQAMWQGDRSYLAELVLPSLVAACRKTPKVRASDNKLVNLSHACDALAHYNGTGLLDASGGWLFSQWYQDVSSTGFWADKFNPAHPLTTPSKLNTANPDILKALADAVQGLQAHDVALDASYGQVQDVVRNGSVIPIPGCDTGCFNAIYSNTGSPSPLAPVGYGEVYDGSSLVMTTELTKSGPVSQGILTYSQATNPRSKWYSNMTKLYSKQKWVPLPYTPAQLSAQSGNTTITLTV